MLFIKAIGLKGNDTMRIFMAKDMIGQLLNLTCEPRHDKTNKVTVCPAKTQISLGIPSAQSDQTLLYALNG